MNNIIDLAFSAPAPAASPNVGRAAGNANAETKLSSFNDIVADVKVDVSDNSGLEVGNEQINDYPQGGIIPIPQIYGTANLIPQIAPIAPVNVQQAAGDYIDLGNNGAIDPATLKALFSQQPAQDVTAQNISAKPVEFDVASLDKGFPLANELVNAKGVNDAVFDEQLAALQNSISKGVQPQGVEKAVADLVATAPQLAQAVQPQKTTATPISDDAVVKAIEADLDAAIQAKIDNAVSLEAKLAETSKSTDPTNSFATLASLNKKVGEDFKDFSSKPIDINEVKFGHKLMGAEHSKLEAQIKHLDAEQFIQRSPVEQVKVKISQGIEMGMDKISIKLNPAELGKVDVDMDVDKDGKTHVRIVADRSETLDFLRKDSGELQKALRELGVHTDGSNMQFSLNQNGNNGGNEAGNQAKNSD